MRLKSLAPVGAIVLALSVAVPAYAHDCTVAKKPATAGAKSMINVTTGEETTLKPGKGGFIALTDGNITTSTFAHPPQGVLPPVREGGPQHNCDGKGLDSLEECFGGE